MTVIGPDPDRIMTPGISNRPNTIPVPAIAVTVCVHLPGVRRNNSSNRVNASKKHSIDQGSRQRVRDVLIQFRQQ